MAPGRITDDSDSDVEFEDVPMNNSIREEFDDIPAFLQPQTWTPSLPLPPQRPEPIPSGSPEEIQVRGQISTRIESVAYRKLQHDIGMESSHSTGPGGRYESFTELAHDVDGLVNTIWASATRKSTFSSLCIITRALLIPVSGCSNRATHYTGRTNPIVTHVLPFLSGSHPLDFPQVRLHL